MEDAKAIKPRHWHDENFGIANPENPAVSISWYEANAYAKWLRRHWDELVESRANKGLYPHLIRLPSEIEWTEAAGGVKSAERYPWDTPRKITKDEKEITRCANVDESGIGHTTPVNAYLRGGSPHGVVDMAGNVWEWQANYYDGDKKSPSIRGGSWDYDCEEARVSARNGYIPRISFDNIGFRLFLLPSL